LRFIEILCKRWEQVAIIDNLELILHYRRIDIVLQEFLQDPKSFEQMNFNIELHRTKEGERIYRDWTTGDWIQSVIAKYKQSNYFLLGILLFCDEARVNTRDFRDTMSF
jgi:hypothetical protein